MESKESSVLLAIFQHLAAFNYNKAKDLAEKERSSAGSITGSSTVWPIFLSCIGKLASVEKLYMNLNLLTAKGFLRRESTVRTAYEELYTELSDLETRAKGGTVTSHQASRSLIIGGALDALGSFSSRGRASTPSITPNGEGANVTKGDSRESSRGRGADVTTSRGGVYAVLLTLSSQLLFFVQARIMCVKFYETCYRGVSTKTPLNYKELAEEVSNISSTFIESLNQTLLKSLRINLEHECDVLHYLMLSLYSIQKHQYLASLLHVDTANEALEIWQKKENKKSSFSSSFLKGSHIPPLYQWFFNLKDYVTAKLSLYFFSSLNSEAPAIEIRNSLSKQPVDFVGRLCQQQRKLDASTITLVLETSTLTDYKGPGYHCPSCPHLSSSSNSSLQSSYPHIPAPPPLPSSQLSATEVNRTFEKLFGVPFENENISDNNISTHGQSSDVSWTSLLQYLRKGQQFATKDKVNQVYNHKSGYTHYFLKIEPLVTAVVSYDCHRTERESSPVKDFLTDLSEQLNLVCVFGVLGPK